MFKKQRIETIEQIGKVVREQRKALGLRQADAAGLLGVGGRFLSELERGKETLAIGKVLQVLQGLKIRIVLDKEKPS